MDDELEQISRELQQLNNSLEDTLKIYANKMSWPRPIYTTPRPTYYNYEEGYTVETSTRHDSHFYLPNRRRNLPVRSSWKKNKGHEVYSIREEIRHVVSKYSKVAELYNKCATLAKTLTDEQAAEFRQLVNKAIRNDYVDDVQFYQNLKIVIEILEDLIDGGGIVKNSGSIIPILYLSLDTQTQSTVKKSPVASVKSFPSVKPCPKNRPKKSQDSGDKKEPEYLSLYTQISTSTKKNCLPQVYTRKIPSTKPGPKDLKNLKLNQETLAENHEKNEKKKLDGTERLLTKKALYHACENWTRKVLKFRNTTSRKKGPIGIKFSKDKTLEKDDRELLIEAGSNERKNSDQLTKPFDGGTLNHAYERYLHREFANPDDASGMYQIGHHYENEKADKKDQAHKKYLIPNKDKKGSRVGFENKKCRSLLYTQKSSEIGHMDGTNNVDGCYNIYNVGYFYRHGIGITKKMLQDLPKNRDILPGVAQESSKVDEIYRIVLSRWLKIIKTFFVLVMISTIRPFGELGINIEGYKVLEKLNMIQYTKGLEKDTSLYVPWYASMAFDPGG
ncbi:hypothetical protein C2G38_2209310 [Gigaspora rosea]|uniref:Uncharacterized protein n=1 Tax=Gigaspora rosea TaxID=44941 RepID=A0A397UGJ2_9GLOM|nr:hypothetical protein C2G38_2209310 [Gigaspora rosea]